MIALMEDAAYSMPRGGCSAADFWFVLVSIVVGAILVVAATEVR